VPGAASALPGRGAPAYEIQDRHAVLGSALLGPWGEDTRRIGFGMGCFWGAERMFWQLPGVVSTIVGYGQGITPNPTYEEVCTGQTGHNEVVEVIYNPREISLEELLTTFWEGHDPTQGMRQGNDIGTQYRSGIYPTSPDQTDLASASRLSYGEALAARGLGPITTEIEPFRNFFPAEEYHQQYLHKVPNGYCGLGGTGVACPVGLDPNAD